MTSDAWVWQVPVLLGAFLLFFSIAVFSGATRLGWLAAVLSGGCVFVAVVVMERKDSKFEPIENTQSAYVESDDFHFPVSGVVAITLPSQVRNMYSGTGATHDTQQQQCLFKGTTLATSGLSDSGFVIRCKQLVLEKTMGECIGCRCTAEDHDGFLVNISKICPPKD